MTPDRVFRKPPMFSWARLAVVAATLVAFFAIDALFAYWTATAIIAAVALGGFAVELRRRRRLRRSQEE